MTVIELKQKRAGLIKQARDLVDLAETEDRSFTAEEQGQYDKLMDEARDILTRAERMQAQDDLEKHLDKIPEKDAAKPDPDPAGDDARAHPRATEEYRTAFRNYLREGRGNLKPDEFRALQADSDSAGGFLVAPQQFVTDLIKAVDNQVFVRTKATKYTVEKAESLGAPALDTDLSDPTWTSEIGAADEDTSLDFGKRELRPHPLSKLIKVSNKLLRISAIDPENIVMDRLAYKFAVVEENGFLNGSGANQPLGVFTASDLGISTGRDVSTGNTTTEIRFDGLIEAKYTLKPQYWARADWVFHRDGAKQIAKLKDGDGQYVWRESVRADEPDRLLGRPVSMSEYAPNTFTTGLYVGVLGDFTHYWIADALNMQVQRLVELYATTNQVGFIGRAELDGMPVNEEAFVRVKLA